jgi:hypothetical protein
MTFRHPRPWPLWAIFLALMAGAALVLALFGAERIATLM